MAARFLPNDPEILELLTGPTGPVFKLVRRVADETLDGARALAPLGEDAGGALKASLHAKEPEISPGESIRIDVVADPVDPRNGFRYGLVAHEGHGVLHAKNPTGLMRFFWPARGRFVRTPEVNETSGTPFLTDALRIVAAEDFRVERGDEVGKVG